MLEKVKMYAQECLRTSRAKPHTREQETPLTNTLDSLNKSSHQGGSARVARMSRMAHPIHIVLIALVAALMLVFTVTATACASDTAKKSSGGHYIFVCPITENPYWQDCVRGINDADEAFGVETKVMGPATTETFFEEMPAYMEKAIDEKPDGILVYAGVPEVAELIDTAIDQGIPVMTVDADAPDTKRLSYIGTDLYEMGYSCGETMVELTGGEGQIAYICTDQSMENEAYVYTAFQDAIHDYSMPVVIEMEGGNTAEKAAEATRYILKKFPNIKGIFATGGENITGIGIACEELGRTDVVAIGLEDTDENLALLRDDSINVLFAQNPYQMGYEAVKLLKSYTEDEGSVKDTVSTGVVKITHDNVDSYKS